MKKSREMASQVLLFITTNAAFPNVASIIDVAKHPDLSMSCSL